MSIIEYEVDAWLDSQKLLVANVARYLNDCYDTWAYISGTTDTTARLVVVTSIETSREYAKGYIEHRLNVRKVVNYGKSKN